MLKASKTHSTSSPLSTFVVQPPVWENWKFTTRPQNWVIVAASAATCLTEKSLNELNQSASQVKPLRRAPSSSAAVAVGTGDGNAPALVPSHGCGPPDDAVVMVCPSVVTGPSKIVLVAPSTRRLTETGAAPAVGAATAAMASATGSEPRMRLVMGHPFLEGHMADGRGQVSWLRAPRRAFPECRRHPSGISDASAPVSQWRDRAGFAPDFPGPPADEPGQHTPADERNATPVATIARRRAAIV